MTIVNRFFIALTLLGTCLPGATWARTVPTGFFYELNVPLGQYLGSTYFAQNDQKKPSDNVSTNDTSKTHKDTNKPKTLTQEKNVPKKTKPVKPFIPSEKIPADQGVDFPYDI
ncbi:MAG: hypothetical protein BMS9Abin03_084 [Thermodesulfobacteriota bacterium]|nr:MAG: hypothetical protein BMS9Abin03_084 [Thermodesulfobacteriota bacterium]